MWNKVDKHSIELAESYLKEMQATLEEYKKGHPHNTQIEVQVDTNQTSGYSSARLELTIYHDWELCE